jgi:uncharacterized protein YutE (UPF0331/DUF86 family)
MDSVVLNKAAIIEKCLNRIREEYFSHEEVFWTNYTSQDSAILNIQRAVQAAIDLAAYVVKQKKWGVPVSSRQSFELLHSHGFIDKEMSEKLKNMVGFRYIAIHEYQQLNTDILEKVIEVHLKDLEDFKVLCLRAF